MTFIIIIIAAFCLYMGLLFLLALKTEKNVPILEKWSAHPLTYASALGIYCTTWTYYGSVGKAATGGLIFLTIYLGPTLAITLWPLILRKMVRIKHAYHTTSIADFISARFNRSESLAALASIIALVGVIPYIALQLRATINTLEMLTEYALPAGHESISLYTVWLILALMIFFTILFGARRLDPTETHKGMILSVAIQSLVQLGAILCVGFYVTYFLFDGFFDILHQLEAKGIPNTLHIASQENPSYMVWGTYLILSMSAIMFLPRQFHVAVVENSDENHIKTAVWFFPLYMLLMNIFLLPIAMGGLLSGLPVEEADKFVLSLPLHNNNFIVAIIVFLGGISAALSMIMISAMTLSTMTTNHLLLPLINHFSFLNFLKKRLLQCRWAFIAGVIFVSYFFETFLKESYMLVNIGLISFSAVLQFSPSVIGGLYWKKANKRGAFMGLLGGFIVWFYTLLWPAMIKSGWGNMAILEQGPWGLNCLKPENLLGIGLPHNIVHSVFWSLSINIILFIFASLSKTSSDKEIKCADNFVDIMHSSWSDFFRERYKNEGNIQLTTKVKAIEEILIQYFPIHEAKEILKESLQEINLEEREKISVIELADLQSELEKRLTGSLGSATAYGLVKESSLFTAEESRILSQTYPKILADLKLSPKELVRKVDFHKEREQLLTEQSKELAYKIIELDQQIKERQLAEEALSQSEYQYRILIENLPQRIFRKDKQGYYTYCNDIYAQDLKLTPKTILGKTDYDLFPPELAKQYRKDDKEVIEKNQLKDLEEMYSTEGEMKWVHTIKVPIQEKGGEVTGVLGIFWDISERKKTAKLLEDAKERLEVRVQERTQELQSTNAQLKDKISELEKTKNELEEAYSNLQSAENQLFQAEKLASIGQLAAGVAHEINNPVGYIKCNLAVLSNYQKALLKYYELIQMLKNNLEEEEEEKRIKTLSEIEELEKEEEFDYILEDDFPSLLTESLEGIEKIRKIVSDLKTFSRNAPKDKTEKDINEVIESILSIVWNEIKYKATLNKDYGQLPPVPCNSQQLGQVLINLFVNAAQSIENHGEIHIRTYQKENYACISIQDTGSGIPEEIKTKIFDPFFTTKEVGTGTGLGLSISYDIIKKHNGNLIVDSTPGQGSTFIIELPLKEKK